MTAGACAALSFVSHGARIDVVSDDAEAVAAARARLPPRSRVRRSAATPDAVFSLSVDGDGVYRLSQEGEADASAPSLATLVDLLESRIDFAVAMAARRRLFVHAGVVVVGDRAVVLPGRSFSGKSTLVLALVQAGASYLSDEYAVFDAEGLVYSWPRPLSLRNPDGTRSVSVPAHVLPAPTTGGPFPVGAVVVTRYVPGARWRPRRRSPAEGVLPLLDNTVMAQSQPRLALATLGRAVADAMILEGPRGEATSAAQALLRRLRG